MQGEGTDYLSQTGPACFFCPQFKRVAGQGEEDLILMANRTSYLPCRTLPITRSKGAYVSSALPGSAGQLSPSTTQYSRVVGHGEEGD